METLGEFLPVTHWEANDLERLRTGVIGVRGIGGRHVQDLADSDLADLVGIADLDQDLAAKLGESHGVKVWSDYRDMVEKENLDAVVIATPHHLHAPMGQYCLEAGLHTFVEKPIANSISEADKMIAAASARNLVLAVGHNYRTFPGNRAMKKLIEEGALGEIYRVLWMWLEARPEGYYDRDIWRCTYEHAGGGVLMNQTSHDLDLLCWMMGDPVEVSAMVSSWGHKAEIEDTAIANIRFASGAHCNVQLSICDRRLNYRQISGDLGTLVYQDEKNANSHIPDEFRIGRYETPMRSYINGEEGGVSRQPGITWEDVHIEDGGETLLNSFLRAAATGGEPITDGITARRTLELINAILYSGIRKEVVELPLDRNNYDALLEELKQGHVGPFRQPR